MRLEAPYFIEYTPKNVSKPSTEQMSIVCNCLIDMQNLQLVVVKTEKDLKQINIEDCHLVIMCVVSLLTDTPLSDNSLFI